MATQKPSKLKTLLKQCNLRIQKYVAALESENAELASEAAQLTAANLRLKNEIKALNKEIRKTSGAPDLGAKLRRARERAIALPIVDLRFGRKPT